MAQELLITLKKNINQFDSMYDCIYTERSDLGDLMNNWLRYNANNRSIVVPLKIRIRDWCIFDQFQADFVKIKDFCPQISSFNDVFMITDVVKKAVIHVSKKEENFLKSMLGGMFFSRDATE